MKILSALPIVLLLSLVPAAPAPAAESYDNCVGFIDSLPATIGSSGTWCLRADLGTAQASGNVINITRNNVTLDCNEFKIGGLAAGPDTRAIGINAVGRSNITIRNCGLRGFWYGVNLEGGSGHLVEANRIDGSTWVALGVEGDGSVIRGNRIMDTGGVTGIANPTKAVGIYTVGDVEVLGNLITGVFAAPGSDGYAVAINPGDNMAGSIIDNNVKNIAADGTGYAYAVSFFGAVGRVSVDSNNFIGPGTANSVGVWCPGSNHVGLSDNIASGFAMPAFDCAYDDGNIVH